MHRTSVTSPLGWTIDISTLIPVSILILSQVVFGIVVLFVCFSVRRKGFLGRMNPISSFRKKKYLFVGCLLSFSCSFIFLFLLKLAIGSKPSGFVTVLTSPDNLDGVVVLGKSLWIHGGSNRRICFVPADLDKSDIKRLGKSGWEIRKFGSHATSVPQIDIFRKNDLKKVFYIDESSSVVVGDISTVFDDYEFEGKEIYHVGSFTNEYLIREEYDPDPKISANALLFQPGESILYDDLKGIVGTKFEDILNTYTKRSNGGIIWKRLPITYDFVETIPSSSSLLFNSALDTGIKIVRFDGVNPSSITDVSKISDKNVKKLIQWWRNINNDDEKEITFPLSKTTTSTSTYGEPLVKAMLRDDWAKEKFPGPYYMTEAKYEVLNNGGKFFPLFLQDIGNATSSIHIVTFGFLYGKLIKKIVDLLIKKKLEGVDVRVVVSHYGSYVTGTCSDWWHWMAVNGIEVVSHDGHPIQHWEDYDGVVGKHRWRDYSGDEWMTFEHRKMAVIDGKISYVGGLGLEDHFYNAADFMVRSEGEIVHQVQQAFLFSFLKLGGRKVFDIFKMQDLFPPWKVFPGSETKKLQLVHQTRDTKYQIRDKYLDLIDHASKKVVMVMSEFADWDLMKSLCDSQARGVDTTLITPKYSRDCVKYAQEATYSTMIGCGVKVFEFVDGELHSKMVIVDDNKVFAGSANTNGPGLYFNLEANVFVDDEGVTKEYLEMMKDDIFDETKRKRIEKYDKSLYEKLRNWVVWELDYWMHMELPCGLDVKHVCDVFVCKDPPFYQQCSAEGDIPDVMKHLDNEIDIDDEILQT